MSETLQNELIKVLGVFLMGLAGFTLTIISAYLKRRFHYDLDARKLLQGEMVQSLVAHAAKTAVLAVEDEYRHSELSDRVARGEAKLKAATGKVMTTLNGYGVQVAVDQDAAEAAVRAAVQEHLKAYESFMLRSGQIVADKIDPPDDEPQEIV